jgi:hypothetical protein
MDALTERMGRNKSKIINRKYEQMLLHSEVHEHDITSMRESRGRIPFNMGCCLRDEDLEPCLLVGTQPAVRHGGERGVAGLCSHKTGS